MARVGFESTTPAFERAKTVKSRPYWDSNSDLSTVQPVARGYIDCAIPAFQHVVFKRNFIPRYSMSTKEILPISYCFNSSNKLNYVQALPPFLLKCNQSCLLLVILRKAPALSDM
jgi:hypothetical protein